MSVVLLQRVRPLARRAALSKEARLEERMCRADAEQGFGVHTPHIYGKHINFTGRPQFDPEKRTETPFILKVIAQGICRTEGRQIPSRCFSVRRRCR